jgi:hypothetical protein
VNKAQKRFLGQLAWLLLAILFASIGKHDQLHWLVIVSSCAMVLWGAGWPLILDSGYRLSERDLYGCTIFTIICNSIFGAIFLGCMGCFFLVVLSVVALLVSAVLR